MRTIALADGLYTGKFTLPVGRQNVLVKYNGAAKFHNSTTRRQVVIVDAA